MFRLRRYIHTSIPCKQCTSICPLCSVHQANNHVTILFVYKLMVFGESIKPWQLFFFIPPSWILKYTIALLMESIKWHTFRLRLRNIRALCTVQSFIDLGNVKWPCSQFSVYPALHRETIDTATSSLCSVNRQKGKPEGTSLFLAAVPLCLERFYQWEYIRLWNSKPEVPLYQY